MELKKLFRQGVYGLLLAAAGGCYEYTAPPAATLGESYTQQNKDQANDLLKGVASLSLADAQRISITNNPTYIAAYHAVSAARMRYLQSLGAYAPTVSAGFTVSDNYSWTRNTRNMNRASTPYRGEQLKTSTTVEANWLVFDGLVREFSVLIADHNYDYQKLLEADECRTLMRAVAYAYNEVLLSIENKRIALEDRKFQQNSLRDTQLKYQAGAVPLSDVLNFEIAMNSADSNLIQADYQYETAIYALAVLMGYPEGTLPPQITFPTDFKTNFVDLPAVDLYLDTALRSRPDLKGYREQLKIATYQMYQTYGSFSPTVNAYATFGYGTGLNRSYYHNYGQTRTYSETPSLGYGLTAQWTIFNGLIRYNRMREYQANVAIADYQVAAQWLTVVGEVRAAYANYLQSVRQTRIYEKIRDLSAQQRDLVDEGYKAGNTEITRLNEAQRDLVQAETNLASSYINIQNAKAQLDAAVSANTAEYYQNPGKTSPGKIENTPVPGLGEGQQVPADDDKTTAPAQAPDESVIPGAAGPGYTSQFPDQKALPTQEPKDPIVPVYPGQDSAANAGSTAPDADGKVQPVGSGVVPPAAPAAPAPGAAVTATPGE